MSWRSGARLFLEMWPLLKKHIPERKERDLFATDLLELFASWDIDPMDLGEFDPELDALIGYEGSDESPEQAVLSCIEGLSDSDPETQNINAEALSWFAGQAGGDYLQMAADALSDACARPQSDEFLICALASLRDLVWEDRTVVDRRKISPLLQSQNPEVCERSQYVINGIEYNS